MTLRVVSVSSSRSDVGILLHVWREIASRETLELSVAFTGEHAGGNSDTASILPQGAEGYVVGEDPGGVVAGMSRAMARIQEDMAVLYDRLAPDLVFVTGDRLDMLPAAVATLPGNIPLAHLHGGEITEGAVDDRIRHAISKLAHVHFATSAGARRRLMALGEDERRIHVSGAPGLDTLRLAEMMDRGAFFAAVGLDAQVDQPLRLVTVHPETNAADAAAPLAAVLGALDARPGTTLFTAPNRDPGGAALRAEIETFARARAWAHFRDTLGSRLYPNALRHAAVMLGNSSSGIIEAGMFGLPVINVGGRQKGREHGANVRHVPCDAGAIVAALDAIPGRYAPGTPYGNGHAAAKIADVLERLPPRKELLDKTFVHAA